MVCDIISNKRVISNVTVEASPPHQEAEVFLPTDAGFKPDEEAKIETAVLSQYYDIDGSYRG